MWSDRSAPPRTRTRSTANAMASSMPLKSLLVLLYCTFLVVVDIDVVTSMSIDRLGNERTNELQSDKQTNLNEQKMSDLIVEDEELEAVPAGGETELYVLLPPGSKSDRDSVDKNTIESDESESTIVQESGGDMIMMESHDAPVMQVVNLPPSKKKVTQKEESEVENKEATNAENAETAIKIKDEHEEGVEKPAAEAINTDDEEDEEDEPIKQVFQNDKDIEDMYNIENESESDKDNDNDSDGDSDNDNDSSEDNLTATITGDVEKEAGEEEPERTESMAELLADVVEEVEKEIESEIVGEKVNEADKKDAPNPKDEEQAKWEETVEKLEEKGSEKHKDQVAENEAALDAAASVLEQLMPEEAVEAMAMAELTENSSEEKEENDKKKEKKPIVANAENVQKDEEKQQSLEKENESKESEKEKETAAVVENNSEPELEHKLEAVTEDKQTDKLEELVKDEVQNNEAEEMKPAELEPELEKPKEEDEDKEAKPNESEEKLEIEQNKDEEKIEAANEAEVPKETHEEKDEASEASETNENSEPNKEEPLEEEGPKIDNDSIAELDTNKETDGTKDTEMPEESKPALEEAHGESKPETIIMQADEQPILVDLDQTVSENNKVEEILANEPVKTDMQPTIESNDDKQTNLMPVEMMNEEIINESEGTNDAVEPTKAESTQPQEPHLEQSINENEQQLEEQIVDEKKDEETEKDEENLLPPQLPQKTEALEELANDKTPTEMSDSTMLTTIIQMPSQEQQQQPQQEQEQQEVLPLQQQANKDEGSAPPQQLQQDEMHSQVDNKVQNEQVVDEIVAAAQMTIASSTQAPQNVAISATLDTVLNYVNATNALVPQLPPPALVPQLPPPALSPSSPPAATIVAPQLQEQQKQQAINPMDNVNANQTEDAPFNAQLRRYDGAQVWRIVVQSDRDRRLADELQSKFDGQLWKEVKQEVDYLLKPQVLADAEKHIRAANLSRIVLIDNLQKVIEVENPALDEFADADNEKGHRLTWHSYHRLADIHDFFDYLARTYPEICAVETIGYSIEKRPLKLLKISNGNVGNPSVWIDGGMHAREWISPASVTYIANQLAEGWENLPSYMQNVNWYLHAVANPDGYEYTHTTDRLWRKNVRSHGRACPGVDLNRNFGYKWGGKGTSANPCSQIYRGSKAFSEPETFYISKFISGYPRDTFHAFLSFHSYGQYILYPWGFDNMVTSDRSDLDRVARAAATTITRASGSKYTVGPSAVTLYPAAGGSDDWAKGIANIKYTYTIEMGDTGRYGFILPASEIESNGKDAYTFVQTVARAISHDMRKRTIKLK